MKYLILLLTLVAAQAWADDSIYSDEVETNAIERLTIYSRGYATGYCDGGPSSWMCMDGVERNAQRDAERDAEMQCRLKNGRHEYFSLYCSKFCNPYNIPANSPPQFVNCRLNCTSTCVIESNP